MNISKIFFALFLILFSITTFSSVHVNGYFRRDGTYVQPHYRSNPNHSVHDNWSTKGNTNPYTGKPGTKNPYPNYNLFQTPLAAPALPLAVNFIKESGKDKINVYKWEDECLISMLGKDSNNNPHSLAIWFPEAPNTLYVIPYTQDINNALIKLNKFNNIDTVADGALSFIVLENKLYELNGEITNKDNYPVLLKEFDHNLTIELMNADYFIVQLKDFSIPEGMTTITFGLFGFSEALAVTRTFCLDTSEQKN